MKGQESPAQDHRDAEVSARINRLELRVDDLDQLFPLPAPPLARSSAETEDESLDQWVASFFTVTFARSLGGEHRWCLRWAEHPEAVFRLRALRQSLLVLRAESLMGEALWLRDHLEPQRGALMSSRGPFAQCSRDRHDLPPPLPVGSSQEEFVIGGDLPRDQAE